MASIGDYNRIEPAGAKILFLTVSPFVRSAVVGFEFGGGGEGGLGATHAQPAITGDDDDDNVTGTATIHNNGPRPTTHSVCIACVSNAYERTGGMCCVGTGTGHAMWLW